MLRFFSQQGNFPAVEEALLLNDCTWEQNWCFYRNKNQAHEKACCGRGQVQIYISVSSYYQRALSGLFIFQRAGQCYQR